MIGLFCKRALQKRRYSGKETYHLIDPTDRSHPISVYTCLSVDIHIYVNRCTCKYKYTYIHIYTSYRQIYIYRKEPCILQKEPYIRRNELYDWCVCTQVVELMYSNIGLFSQHTGLFCKFEEMSSMTGVCVHKSLSSFMTRET